MSQQELAKALGTSRCTVNRIEQGKQQPHPKLKARIEVWMERQCQEKSASTTP